MHVIMIAILYKWSVVVTHPNIMLVISINHPFRKVEKQ